MPSFRAASKGENFMEKSLKKILIAVLAIICFACIATAVACQTDKERYTLTYIHDECVTVEGEAKNGASVVNGTEISFKLIIAEGAEGAPIVNVNGGQLLPGGDGVYKFKMKGDTTVEITGVYFSNVYTVEFSKEYKEKDEDGNEYTYVNDFFEYLDTEGNKLETAEVASGEKISFRIRTSVYYGKSVEYTVMADTSVVTADADGVYSFGVAGDTKVTVEGLPTDLAPNSFAGRKDGGKGTKDEPFLIREPVDLYVMSDFIESEWNTSGFYQTAYYSLENDIDMEGETLHVIGNTLTQLSIFAGIFDGNGHTIKNYTMTNSLIEQSEFGEIKLPYVGLFGFAFNAGIYNLNLKDFVITIEGMEDNVFAGSFAGYARGVNIQNCSAEGVIKIQGSDETSFAGGIVGAIESFNADEERLTASVQSCSTDVEISALSGNIYAAGGIAGFLYTAEERLTASILNCFATGDIYGVMRAGGIAGQVSSYSSIKNCYATGNIEADNAISEITGNEFFSYAYAGGIAAYAEYGCAISNCFFTGTVEAYATQSKYEETGGIVAGSDKDGTEFIYTVGTLVKDCYFTQGTDLSISDGFIKASLGWSEADWKFNGDGLPQINKDSAKKVFTVTVKIGDDTVHEWEIDSYYASMGHWYSYYSATLDQTVPSGIPEFIGTGNRTYGYYFDKELTVKVPFGYIPTDDLTIYADYADYSSVSGTYYLQGKEGYIELTDDGYLYYRDGALNVISTYVYNGDYIILYNTFLAILVDEEYDFYTFKANVNGGVMSIYDYEVYKQSAPLLALKKFDGFRYGVYYDARNNEYTFNADGTGFEKLNNGVITNFTFTVTENGSDYEVEVKYGTSGASRPCTVENGIITSFNAIGVSVYDNFKGVWESSAGAIGRYEFDGAGNWTYKYYDYDASGKEVVLASDNGTYTLNGETLTLDGKNTEVSFSDNFLSVNGETFYKENSFVGTWSFAGRPVRNEPIEVTFRGIGLNGYGKASVKYAIGKELEVDYSSETAADGTVTVKLYYYYTEWGTLVYDKTNKTLTGVFYSNAQGILINNVIFCLYDDLKGTWTGGDETLSSLKFDGLGRYDVEGSADCMETDGNVFVNGGKDSVKYTLNDGWLTGSFTYKGKSYTFVYDRDNDTLTVNSDGAEYTFSRKN